MNQLPRRRLEIWTARITRAIEDPDSLDITRRTADAYTKAIQGWPQMDDPHRAALYLEGVNRARDRARAGIPLAKQHALALGDGLPSLGAPWAPSWTLLNPALSAIELANRLADEIAIAPEEQRADRLRAVMALEQKSWTRYQLGELREGVQLHGFEAEMRVSYRQHAAAWRWAVQRDRLVARCWCGRPSWWPVGVPWDHCHRFLAAIQLVKAAQYAGREAVYMGEIEAPPDEPSPQMGLPIG